jgi:hypothetical protein
MATEGQLQVVIDRFLGCSMKLEQTVEKPSQWLIARVEGEVQGFGRAQDLLRHFLENPEPETDLESERVEQEAAAEIHADWEREEPANQGGDDGR